MNHPFVASTDGSDRCARCKYPHVAHTDKATCDCCPNIGVVDIRYGNMLMCAECWSKEQQLHNEKTVVESVQKVLNTARASDNTIEVLSDLFNAETVSIVDIKKAITENPEITNKPYALGEYLTTRFKHFQETIFSKQQEITELANRQRAIQVYLNNLANELRAEEREKLKIADINYRPGTVKPIKPKVIGVSGNKTGKTKIDKVALKKAATELGISEFMIQQIVISKGVTVEKAAEIIKASIAAAKGV